MKVIAFGGSYSKTSINKKFATYAASCFKEAEIEVLDLNDYQLPLYSTDLEGEIGLPQAANDFLRKIEEADMVVVSLAEHNGSYTTGFKNLFDWTSRVKVKMFEGKKVLLLSTAPGPRGGLSVLETATTRFPSHGAELVGTFSLPVFAQNFSEDKGIINEELKTKFEMLIEGICKEASLV